MNFLKVAGRRPTINEFLVTPLTAISTKDDSYSCGNCKINGSFLEFIPIQNKVYGELRRKKRKIMIIIGDASMIFTHQCHRKKDISIRLKFIKII